MVIGLVFLLPVVRSLPRSVLVCLAAHIPASLSAVQKTLLCRAGIMLR